MLDRKTALKNISQNVARMLKVRGWKVADLVRASHEPHNTVYRVFRGENIPDAVTLANIADALDTTTDKLMETPSEGKLQTVA